MRIAELDPSKRTITIEVPLTEPTGKVRIKERTSYTEFGIPVATRRKPFNSNMYVEWQIGYDVETGSKRAHLSTLINSGLIFRGFNGKFKTLYELSEFLYYFKEWGVFRREDLLRLIDFVEGIKDGDLIEERYKIYYFVQ